MCETLAELAATARAEDYLQSGTSVWMDSVYHLIPADAILIFWKDNKTISYLFITVFEK